LTAIDLREISVVSAWLAYPNTTVFTRARSCDTKSRLALARRCLETVRWACSRASSDAIARRAAD
jgi:hypothetical protein